MEKEKIFFVQCWLERVSDEKILLFWYAKPGTPVILEGQSETDEKPAQIGAEIFFAIEIKVVDKVVQIDGKALMAGGKIVTTEKTINGEVH